MRLGEDDMEYGRQKGRMFALDQRLDQPLGIEASRIRIMDDGKKVMPFAVLLKLSFQTLGVVYGDLGTSPLYVFRSTFPHGVDNKDDLLGALSLILYTLTLIPLVKYMFVVLQANDNGEGGTFSLYALLCRYANISSIPNRHPTDEELTTYRVKLSSAHTPGASTKKMLEKSKLLQQMLLILVLLSTCMVIGDGILTPPISVLSAVDGIKVASSKLNQTVVVVISLTILVALFSVQRFGTGLVGFMFAPVVLFWFLAIGTIGIYNIRKYDSSVFSAFSPYYVVHYFKINKRAGWESLGGVVLCITGTEALYADLGHFSALSIQIAFSVLVFPCLVLAYLGQTAYLLKHPEDVSDAFYKSVPDSIYWPMFVLATIAASIASQAIISATFSIVKQSMALGCFPRVKVVHTSNHLIGQVYIPEVNWILMTLCLVITASFKDTTQIGNAYGIAVVGVMLATTSLMSLIIVVVWQKHAFWGLLFLTLFGSLECVYYSAVLFKVQQGGWVPLAIAGIMLTTMYSWHYGSVQRYEYEIQNKVSVGWVLGLGPSLGLVRVPGVGLVYTDLAHGVPPIFSHFITNLPAIHSTLVFVCIKYLPVNTVPEDERFHIKRVGPKEYSIFRCAARYGYMDLHKKEDGFEQLLIQKLANFMRYEAIQDGTQPAHQDDSSSEQPRTLLSRTVGPSNSDLGTRLVYLPSGHLDDSIVSVSTTSSSEMSEGISGSNRITGGDSELDELAFLYRNRESGVVYLLGNTVVRARSGSSLPRKLLIDFFYAFLRRTCRESRVTLNVPHESLLQVGMIYYV